MTLYSIAKHHPNQPLEIHILSEDISRDHKENLEKLAASYPTLTLHLINVEKDSLNNIQLSGDGLPHSAYYSFLFPDLLPDIDKVIYLDVDILVKKSIVSLWQTDISKVSLGVITEIDMYATSPDYSASIGLTDQHHYFNSGVLVMNLKKMRKEQPVFKLLETTKQYSSKLRYGDQDILNMVFKDDILLCNYSYNFTNWRLMYPEISDQEPAIIHFSGSKWTKPWMKKEDTFDYLAPYLEDYQSYKIEYLNILQPEAKTIELFLEVHQGHHVAECIESILRQTYVHFQVSLILDKVTPETLELCSRFAEKDKRIKLLEKVKQPIFQQYGQLIEESQADYISFIREQDILEENYLSEFIQLSQQVQAPIYLSNYLIYDENSSLFYFHHPLQDHDGNLSVELTQPLSYQQENYLEHLWGKFLQREYAASQLKDYCGNLRKTSFYQDKKIGYCHQTLYKYRNEKQELISIVIAAYNVEQYLEECLENVLNQTYQHLEILLIDDGSTDNSKNICQTFTDADNRFRYIYQENQGVSAARNQGMNQMQGKYFCFVDSDDVLSEQFVEKLHRTAQEFSDQVVVGNYYKYLEKEQHFLYHNVPDYFRLEVISKQDCIKAQCHQVLASGNNFVTVWGTLYHRSLVENISFPLGKLAEDEAVNHKFYLHADRVAFHNEDLYLYRVRENSIMTNPDLYLKLIHDSLDAFGEKIKDICLAGLEPTDMVNFYQHYLQVHCHNLEQLNLANSPLYNRIKEQLSLI